MNNMELDEIAIEIIDDSSLQLYENPILDPIIDDDIMDIERNISLTFKSYFINCFKCSKPQLKRNCRFCCNFKRDCKFTCKRLFSVIFLILLYSGAGVLFWIYGPYVFTYINSLELFLILNITEIFINLISLFYSTPIYVDSTSKEELSKLAIIIPIHGKDKNIIDTLDSLYRIGIEWKQIFLIENTGKRYSVKDSATVKLMLNGSKYQEINYFYTDIWGSKVAAEFLGGLIAETFDFRYMMAIDDDVLIPKEFDPYLSLIKDDITMIGYAIQPSNLEANYLTQMQKREYQKSDRNNYFKFNLGTILAPHGAISVCRLDRYLEYMLHRPVDGAFFAEDQKKGMAWRWGRNRIAIAPGVPVGTEVPPDFATFWAQRVGSWDTGFHMSSFLYLEDFITDCPKNCNLFDFIAILFRKLYQLQTLFSIISDIIKPIILVSFITSWYFWIIVGISWEINNIIDIFYEVYFYPHHQNKDVCIPSDFLSSFVDHHLSIFYILLQIVNGITACFCAWIGAGAADPEEYPIKIGYPKELKEIFLINNYDKRKKSLLKYARKVLHDPRKYNVKVPILQYLQTVWF